MPRSPKTTYRLQYIIFVLSKLFSNVILGRCGALLDVLQDLGQGGFRPDCSCSDVVMFMRMIANKAQMGRARLGASLDMENAFDKVHHSSVRG